MTGFNRRTFRLEFEDPSFSGLEVRMRSATLGEVVRLQELMNTNFATPDHADELTAFHELLAGKIISWNLLDDSNEPVVTDAQQIAKEEWPLIKAIAFAWLQALVAVPPPLSRPSSGGDRLAELSIPMETLSESPPSLSSPSES